MRQTLRTMGRSQPADSESYERAVTRARAERRTHKRVLRARADLRACLFKRVSSTGELDFRSAMSSAITRARTYLATHCLNSADLGAYTSKSTHKQSPISTQTVGTVGRSRYVPEAGGKEPLNWRVPLARAPQPQSPSLIAGAL